MTSENWYYNHYSHDTKFLSHIPNIEYTKYAVHMYAYICAYTLYTYLFQYGQGRYPHHYCKSHPLPNSSTSSYDLHTTRTLTSHTHTHAHTHACTHNIHTYQCLTLSYIFITRAPNFRHFITLDFIYSLILWFISTDYSTHTLYGSEISSSKEACEWYSYIYIYMYIVYKNYDITSPQKLEAVQYIHTVHYIVHIQWPYNHVQVTCDIELYITIRQYHYCIYTLYDTHSGWLVSTSRNHPVTDMPPEHTGLLPPSFYLSMLPRQPLVPLQLTALVNYNI